MVESTHHLPSFPSSPQLAVPCQDPFKVNLKSRALSSVLTRTPRMGGRGRWQGGWQGGSLGSQESWLPPTRPHLTSLKRGAHGIPKEEAGRYPCMQHGVRGTSPAASVDRYQKQHKYPHIKYGIYGIFGTRLYHLILQPSLGH